jgi:cytochrome c554/c'-like protein
MIWVCFLLLGYAPWASGQQERYVGVRVCGTCHPAQAERQSGTGHARALSRAAAHPLAPSFAPQSPMTRAIKYKFEFSLDPDNFTVQAYDNEYKLQLPIQWAFGAGRHAVTFVSRVNDEIYLEHSFSYYSEAKSLDVTPGHEGIQPQNLYQAMGITFKTEASGRGIVNCFQCHSTGPVTVSAGKQIEITEPGVRCENCHGPGGGHVDAIKRGQTESAKKLIGNPTRLSGEELNQLCGNCHRFPGAQAAVVDWSYPWNVRHQPPYFRQSKCFQDSNGKFTCLTCHSPHDSLRQNQPAYYSEKCMSCHHAGEHAPQKICMEQKPSDCTSCHMPDVDVSPRLRFKNHWIGIYKDGAKLKPN